MQYDYVQMNFGTPTMKNTLLLPLAMSLAMLACTPKNEDIKAENIEVGPASEVIDTIVSPRKDALRTDENNITPVLPMPQSVMQLLAVNYPGWEEPVYTESVLKAATDAKQGPGVVRGDFNGDGRQDYAIQLRQKNKIIVLAVLDGDDENWQFQELKKDIVFNDRGILKSPYMLRVAEKGTDLKHPVTGAEIEAPHEAIVLSIQDNNIVFLLQEGVFEAFSLEE